jgi:prevent-host-death family protein
MEMSVREVRAQFASALNAAERGERVTITKNGRAVAELGPVQAQGERRAPSGQAFWDHLERTRKELGIEPSATPLDEAWRREFDSLELAREIFGPEYFGGEPDRA